MPLYPYGRRRTLVRELVPGQVWSFEQLQGIFYVAVPIRMTVLRLREGLLLYGPVAPTRELLVQLRQLEATYGPVCTIVLATSSGLEHKLPLPALARAFPRAQVWVSPGQWSFPVQLPLRWLGFPPGRTHTLIEDGLPHGDQLVWDSLGPVDLGLGRFQDVCCLHRASGSLLVTDSLVAIGAEPPELFDADPTPLLFHARDRGDEPLIDSAEQRRKGWQRLVLFASYFQPAPLEVRPMAEVWSRLKDPKELLRSLSLPLAGRLAGGLRGPAEGWPAPAATGAGAGAPGVPSPSGPAACVAGAPIAAAGHQPDDRCPLPRAHALHRR